MRHTKLPWMLGAVLVTACKPAIPDGLFLCEQDQDCPAGMQCVDGRCSSDDAPVIAPPGTEEAGTPILEAGAEAPPADDTDAQPDEPMDTAITPPVKEPGHDNASPEGGAQDTDAPVPEPDGGEPPGDDDGGTPPDDDGGTPPDDDDRDDSDQDGGDETDSPEPDAPTCGVVVGLSAGAMHTCAWTDLGHAYCWGHNEYRQLGQATPDETCGDDPVRACSRVPVGVRATPDGPLLGGIEQIDSGSWHSCARTTEGHVYCWGANWVGAAGAQSPTPMVGMDGESILQGVRFLEADNESTCAVLDESVVCWGRNANYQLASNADTDDCSQPCSRTPALANFASAPAIFRLGSHHGCALIDGEVQCWGHGVRGALGNGALNGSFPQPAAVQFAFPLPGAVTQMELSGEHSCIVTGGTVVCWGDDDHAPVNSIDNLLPQGIANLQEPVSRLFKGARNTCAVDAEGILQCWGRALQPPAAGQPDWPMCGEGDQRRACTPGPVAVRAAQGPLKNVQAVSISNGSGSFVSEQHACMLLDGRVWCWGQNTYGQSGPDASEVPCGGPQSVSGSCLANLNEVVIDDCPADQAAEP